MDNNTRPEAGDILNEYVQNEYKLSMWIPKDLGGKVIGKRGVVITNLQRESKAKQINALQPVGNSLWIAVVILGGYRNVIAAYNSISDIVEHEVDGVVLEFMINYKKPFFLYGGKKFAIIKRISADTNVRIFFPEFNPKEQSFSEALPVSLEGECADVQRAVEQLEQEALHYRKAQEIRYGPGGYKYDDAAEKATEAPKSRNTVTREPPRLIDTRDQAREQNNRNQQHGSSPQLSGVTNSASKAQRLMELVNNNKTPASKDLVREERSEVSADGDDDRVQIEKTIEVPSTLVGLLLSKKPRSKITTLNIMQHMTHTIISKIINPDTLDPESVEAYEAAQAQRNAEQEAEEHQDGNNRHNNRGPRGVKPVFKNAEGVNVTFRIMGFTEESVDMVIEHLVRIIGGDRIREVMDELRVSARRLEYKAKGKSNPAETQKRYHSSAAEEQEPRRFASRDDYRRDRDPRPSTRGGDARDDRFIKHTTEGVIFGGANHGTSQARGGRAGPKGRADFAGGRGRDFGRDAAAVAEAQHQSTDSYPSGGRGGGRGFRGERADRGDRSGERSDDYEPRREGGRGGRGSGRGGYRNNNSRDVREV